MSIEIQSDRYEYTYGRKPRGFSSWGFSFKRNGAWTDELAPTAMSFSDAKKWAIKFARSIGATSIIVLP